MKKKRKKPKWVQNHHISYDPEIVTSLYRGEHAIMTLAFRYTRKKISKGFIQSLKHFIVLNENRAHSITTPTIRRVEKKKGGN